MLKQNDDNHILVAGYDWLPATLDLIEEGWIGWAQGNSLYQEGNFTAKVLFDHLANGTPLPKARRTAKPSGRRVNLEEVRNSPDVTMAG